MAATPDIVRQSDLLNRLVIDLNTAEEVGRVVEVLVDPKGHQVEGFICKTGLIGRDRRTFSWVQIESIGKDSVIVGPVTDHAPYRLTDTQPMLGQEIWSDAGERLGRLVDFQMNARTGLISLYGFAPENQPSPPAVLYTLSPAAIISAGRKRLMVKASAVEAPTIFEPVQGQPRPSAEPAKPSYGPSPETLEAARQTSQELAEQLQAHTRQLTDTAKSQWGQVFGQVRKRTRKLRSQLRETVTDMTTLPAGYRLSDDPAPTIDVDSIEIWPDEDSANELAVKPSDPQDSSERTAEK